MSTPALGSKIAFGAIWMVGMRLFIRSIGLISTLILVRLLEPADFGLVAIVTAIIAAIETMKAFGLEVALIQDQSAGPDEYNTVWTMEIILAALTSSCIALIAAPAAQWYDEPRITSLLYILAIANFALGFRNVGIVDFRKQLHFARDFRYNVAIKLIGFIVTISAAWYLRSYWALVIGIVTTKLSGVILSYWMHDFRPRFSLTSVKKLFRFSKWLLINNLSIVARLRGPDFLVGKFAGATGLGHYSIAYEIANMPTTELIAPINRALFPGFSKIAHDLPRARNAFVQASSVVALFSLPIALGVSSVAELIGSVVLGEKWLATIPIIKMLAISGAVTAVASPITSAIIAMGRPAWVSMAAVINACIVLPTVALMASADGAVGAARAVMITTLCFLPVYFTLAFRLLRLDIFDIVNILFRPTVAAITMFVCVRQVLALTALPAINLMLAATIGAVVYLITLLLFWSIMPRTSVSGERYLFERIRPFVAKFGAGSQ
ncbi:MAG: lipopolysaccharide biosynthesis protein [Pseudomonadota bacterium]